MKKRILYVLPDLSVIGAQRLAVDYGMALQANGYDVKWCTGSMSGGFLNELDSDQVMSFSDRVFSKIKIVRLIEKLVRLLVIIRSQKADVIISITPFYNRVICVFKMFNLVGSKIIIEDHAYPPESYIDEFSEIPRFIYKRTEFLYRYSDKFRVLSDESKTYYDDSLKGNFAIFQNNFLNLDRILDLSVRFPVTLPKKIKPRMVYIGRFTTQKNVSFLINSFSLLHKIIDCELFLIGYGPEEDSLKKLVCDLKIEGCVFFIPSSKHNFANLSTADLFPIVSIWEGMPLVMFEAMSLKIPVVATNFKAGPKFIIGSKNERGIVVQVGDEDSFAKSMHAALMNIDGLTLVRVNAAFSFVRESIDINNNFGKYISTFVEGY